VLKAKQVLKKTGRLKFRVDVTSKRLMQQDGVESLQSDRESLEEIVPPYHQWLKWFCEAGGLT